MIFVRIDERLNHGQVNVGWLPHLRAGGILVASDRISADPEARMIRQACAGFVSVEIDTVAGLIGRIGRGEFSGKDRILLFEDLESAARAIELGLKVDRINIGGLRHEAGAVLKLCPEVALNDADGRMLEGILRRGITVEAQPMPQNRPIQISLAMLGGRS
jgi:PTS system mannose-specific IIB component